MNQISHDGGNEAASALADIPWLQDRDDDGDGKSDVWLGSWPYVYRDVVIVDANNVAVDTFNLTTHNLAEPENFQALRQALVDVASSVPTLQDDHFAVAPDSITDIRVLANDELSHQLELVSASAPSHGTAEIVRLEYPADLSPSDPATANLLISEVSPGQFIELFNTSFAAVDFSETSHQLVSSSEQASVASLATETEVGPRGYVRLSWPGGFSATNAAGEVVLFRDDQTGFDDATKLDDFVAWGAAVSGSRLELAEQAGKWSGDRAAAIQVDSIQRIPRSPGTVAAAYDSGATATPAAAPGNETDVFQAIRYHSDDTFSGDVTLSYEVRAQSGATNNAELTVTVSQDASPWQNPLNHLDVNDDGFVTPSDALAIINGLNDGFQGLVPSPLLPIAPPGFLDSSGNGAVAPIDALLVINHLNAANAEAEGEYTGTVDSLMAHGFPWTGETGRPREVEERAPRSVAAPPAEPRPEIEVGFAAAPADSTPIASSPGASASDDVVDVLWASGDLDG